MLKAFVFNTIVARERERKREREREREYIIKEKTDKERIFLNEKL